MAVVQAEQVQVAVVLVELAQVAVAQVEQVQGGVVLVELAPGLGAAVLASAQEWESVRVLVLASVQG